MSTKLSKVIHLIVAIAERDFVVSKEPNDFPVYLRDLNGISLRDLNTQPRSTADFQKVVLDWYALHHAKTLTERKVADVNDTWFRNRFDAIEWLGQHKSAAGRPVIARRVDTILDDKKMVEHTTLFSELSLCALALGKIGDPASLPQVSRVCRFMAEERRWAVGSGGPTTLFEAFHGRALLGQKEGALRDLQALYEKYRNEMEPARQKEFQENLDQASHW